MPGMMSMKEKAIIANATRMPTSRMSSDTGVLFSE